MEDKRFESLPIWTWQIYSNKNWRKRRYLRKSKGLTQTQLAQLVGKDRQYLYKRHLRCYLSNCLSLFN
ncbi:helix-turn-helix domain-containing protein [Mariniflexile sp. HMF6888]|uniref:helix-turn-helix domain-containing protein n=1 Tax=Mariniflexile sp. HMF6888 TaxID=3373086 RepID=UPI0037B81EE5